jgi:magnesium transporter
MHLCDLSKEEVNRKSLISVFNYSKDEFYEDSVFTLDELKQNYRDHLNTWINIDALRDQDLIKELGEHFHLHPLYIEDVLDTNQLPKIEENEDYLFFIFKSLDYNEETHEVEVEQISLILGDKFVLTFQEHTGDPFDAVRDRIRTKKGIVRDLEADYLACRLLEAVVSNYFSVAEKLGERIEFLEEDLVKNPTPSTLQIIHHMKTSLINLRRSIWPLREVIFCLMDDTSFVTSTTRPYLRDVYDHTIHIMELLESYRDIVSGLLDVYLSSISYKLNETMKVLTMIATVFIPLTFISGWYGMNFKTMPEIEWQYGYMWVISLAIFTIVTIIAFFKRRRWL